MAANRSLAAQTPFRFRWLVFTTVPTPKLTIPVTFYSSTRIFTITSLIESIYSGVVDALLARPIFRYTCIGSRGQFQRQYVVSIIPVILTIVVRKLASGKRVLISYSVMIGASKLTAWYNYFRVPHSVRKRIIASVVYSPVFVLLHYYQNLLY